ncbi:hypothetical protein GCM10010302_26190 [Streptomyces polychromogenes]|uniref:Uncharacterized protein n=1 Tax=Streptomyces polychromogenes TaxID=67342 RepID=A0ABN0VC69_9ACTN
MTDWLKEGGVGTRVSPDGTGHAGGARTARQGAGAGAAGRGAGMRGCAGKGGAPAWGRSAARQPDVRLRCVNCGVWKACSWRSPDVKGVRPSAGRPTALWPASRDTARH